MPCSRDSARASTSELSAGDRSELPGQSELYVVVVLWVRNGALLNEFERRSASNQGRRAPSRKALRAILSADTLRASAVGNVGWRDRNAGRATEVSNR